jgi:hypothetical protein
VVFLRLVKTDTISQGTYLGKAIYNDKGKILLNEGVKLDQRLLKRLIGMGIHYIYIKDQKTKDIIIREPISAKMRNKAMNAIEQNFLELKNVQIQSNSVILEKVAGNLKDLIQDIIFEIGSVKGKC